MMTMSEWQDLHNDNPGDDEMGRDIVEVIVGIGHEVCYKCKVEVKTFRNIPSEAEIIAMLRLDFSGEHTEEIEVEPIDFPVEIAKAAEKKALYMLGYQ